MHNPPLPSQIRLMNGQDQYAPERGVGGFPEFGRLSNTCANCGGLRSSIWRPLAGRFGSLLGVSWRALGSQFGIVELCILELIWGSECIFVLVRYLHGRARGTKSRLRKLCPLAPLPDQSSTSPLGEGELWFGTVSNTHLRAHET